MTEKQNLLARIFLISGALIFFISEFITAAAWSHPAYSYTYDFISNLGVRGPSTLFGQYMISPLSWLMNAGFIMFGIVLFIGTVFLPVKRGWARIVVLGLGLLLAVGGTLVGVFHGSGEALANGTGAYHSLGAFIAFISGNVLFVTLGIKRVGLPVSPKARLVMRSLGILGLICMVLYVSALMFSTDNHPIIIISLIERGAAYPMLISALYLGFTGLKHNLLEK